MDTTLSLPIYCFRIHIIYLHLVCLIFLPLEKKAALGPGLGPVTAQHPTDRGLEREEHTHLTMGQAGV